jgi:hypothetical protein
MATFRSILVGEPHQSLFQPAPIRRGWTQLLTQIANFVQPFFEGPERFVNPRLGLRHVHSQKLELQARGGERRPHVIV